MIIVNGWQLLFHECLVNQLQNLHQACQKAKKHNDVDVYLSNANVKLFAAVSKLIFQVIPEDPNRDEYRQGNTMGTEFRHWRRTKIGRRFRLFFRFDTRSKIIIFAWLNDNGTLRNAGGKNDPYVIFKKMLDKGKPPDNWDELLSQSNQHWQQ